MDEEKNTQTKYRLESRHVFNIVFWAISFDSLTLIPFVGNFLGPLYWIVFSLYLLRRGCGFINGRRLATAAASVVIEMIPVLSVLPTLTLGSVIVIALIRAEDVLGMQKGMTGSWTKKGIGQSMENIGKAKAQIETFGEYAGSAALKLQEKYGRQNNNKSNPEASESAEERNRLGTSQLANIGNNRSLTNVNKGGALLRKT